MEMDMVKGLTLKLNCAAKLGQLECFPGLSLLDHDAGQPYARLFLAETDGGELNSNASDWSFVVLIFRVLSTNGNKKYSPRASRHRSRVSPGNILLPGAKRSCRPSRCGLGWANEIHPP